MNNSDEEKKAINDLNFIIVTDIYDNEVSIDKTKIINEYNKSVGIVLNLIEKQSKEIEELKNADLTTVYLNGVYDGEKKVKDKIKAKIEEIDIEIQCCEYADDDTEEYKQDIEKEKRRLLRDKAVLQSLLEKE